MKGIVMAGGKGSRLYPITFGINKQLLHIYDKPLIYYPLSILMLSKIREILIITDSNYVDNYKKIFGNGENLGLKIEYVIQENPDGIAEAFILGEKFIGDDDVCLILGDNILFKQNFSEILFMSKFIIEKENCALIYTIKSKNPEKYGVIDLDENNKIISIEEKPINPKSNNIVIGLYMYPNSVIEFAKKLKPSKRNELEITDLNNLYLAENKLKCFVLEDVSWFDCGTIDNLLEANNFIYIFEKNFSIKISCLEEIAYLNQWIDCEIMSKNIKKYNGSEYAKYLSNICSCKKF